MCPKFMFTTISVHLHLGCLEFYSGHPIFRYKKKVVQINSRPICLQKSDWLYLNLTYIHFESDLNSVEHPLSTTNLLIFSLLIYHLIHAVPFTWFKWLCCLHLVAFTWLHSLGCIHFDAFAWLHSVSCIHMVAFTWLHSLGYIHVVAFTWLYSLTSIHFVLFNC
jgi:hypothetical protein